MAKGDIKFHCGCGFSTTNPLEAALHCDSTGHSLDVNGTVKPDKENTKPDIIRKED